MLMLWIKMAFVDCSMGDGWLYSCNLFLEVWLVWIDYMSHLQNNYLLQLPTRAPILVTTTRFRFNIGCLTLFATCTCRHIRWVEFKGRECVVWRQGLLAFLVPNWLYHDCMEIQGSLWESWSKDEDPGQTNLYYQRFYRGIWVFLW
jgi:hypothetical protein